MNLFTSLFNKPNPELVVGGIYIEKRNKGTYPYRVHKILAIEENTVAVMIYRNSFKEFPQNLDIATLTVGISVDEDPTNMFNKDSPMQLGAGCVSIDKKGYLSGNPILIKRTTLTAEELDFYYEMHNQ